MFVALGVNPPANIPRVDEDTPPNPRRGNLRRDQQTKKGPHVHRAAARAARSRRGVRFYWTSIRSAREPARAEASKTRSARARLIIIESVRQGLRARYQN